MVLDEDLEVTFMNPAAEALFGLSERQVLGRRIADIFRPADELVHLCRRALASGLTFGLHEFAARIGERDLKLDCSAAPLDDDTGLLLELVDAERDRSVRREAALIAQQQLSRRIVRQLAHEVKNPLGGMRGAAQLLERQLDSPDLKTYTKVIIEEADRLAALVDSTLQAGGEPQPEQVNLHEITEHVAKLISAEKGAEIELIRDYDPSLPPLHVDRSQMIQAFLNLARNALQAVGKRGTLIFRTRALTHVVIRGEHFRLVLSAEVQDNGPGIPPELQETVFFPLVSGRSVGTGLGLTIAQDLVGRNGGFIEFTSEPGKTVFQMRLPVTTSPDLAAAEEH